MIIILYLVDMLSSMAVCTLIDLLTGLTKGLVPSEVLTALKFGVLKP